MNDFLHSLRNNRMERQRAIMIRKNQGTAANHNLQQPLCSVSMPQLQGAIESLTANVDGLAENQKYLISVQEKIADILERQAIAVERILDCLNIQ